MLSYHFDEHLAEAGPDTYQIFEHNYGRVGLSTAFKFSGYRALKIQDVAEDGGFPELQGYFKTLQDGKLFFHFAFMVAEVEETFNIALAGESHFQLSKNGIGFWLDNHQGTLRHRGNHKPVDLFRLTPFMWYEVDLGYDISAGQYDLVIKDEYGEYLTYLNNQPNAVNLPGSTVNKFSFIGDLEDRQNASYYVDDIMIYSENEIRQGDFIAPGRRKLFVDSWNDYHKSLYGKIQCLPATQTVDFGIDTERFFELVKQDQLQLLNALLENQLPQVGKWREYRDLYAIYHWQKGCSALKSENWQLAIDYFRSATDLASNARIYSMSLALAYAGAGQYQIADNLLAGIQAQWINDQRLAVTYAMVGLSRNDSQSAADWLAIPAFDSYEKELLEFLAPLHAGHIDKNTIANLKSYAPDDWPHFLQQAVITEQYYFALLWQKRYQAAKNYAVEVISKLENLDIQSFKWHERAADAAFYNQTYDEAIDYYLRALAINDASYPNYLKLSDIYHLIGDVEREREYRQQVYGKFDDSY